MRHRTAHTLFFITAGLFAWVGIDRMTSGGNQGSVFGLAMAVFWFILGLNIKRKQQPASYLKGDQTIYASSEPALRQTSVWSGVVANGCIHPGVA